MLEASRFSKNQVDPFLHQQLDPMGQGKIRTSHAVLFETPAICQHFLWAPVAENAWIKSLDDHDTSTWLKPETNKAYLVGGLNPSEKYSSIGMIISSIWENKSHVPVTTNQLFNIAWDPVLLRNNETSNEQFGISRPGCRTTCLQEGVSTRSATGNSVHRVMQYAQSKFMDFGDFVPQAPSGICLEQHHMEATCKGTSRKSDAETVVNFEDPATVLLEIQHL